MTSFLNWIENHSIYQKCLIGKLRGRRVKCEKPDLTNIPRYLILDCDKCEHLWQVKRGKQTQHLKRPDFLLFLEFKNKIIVIILEITEGRVGSYEPEQIEGGLRLLEDMIQQYSNLTAENIYVRGYVVHSGSVADIFHDVKGRLTIQIGGKKIPVEVCDDRCGQKLKNLIDSKLSRMMRCDK